MAIGPEGKSPKKAFISYKLSIQYLRTFRCIVYIDILPIHKDKLDSTSRKTILVRYLPISKQY